MNKNKLWVVGAVLIMLALVGGGWLIGIQPQLSAVASANQNRLSVASQNAKNQLLLSKLKKDYEGITALKNQLDTLRAAVPAGADISTFVSELNGLASTHKITVKSISVSDAKPYAPAPPVPASTPGGRPSVTTTNPRITSTNFVLIPLQFSVTGNYATVLDFVHDVQTGPRLFFVSTFTTTGSTTAAGVANSAKASKVVIPEKVDATIGGFVYVLLSAGDFSKVGSGS
jgi:Tfp pilus assembly protein PilO